MRHHPAAHARHPLTFGLYARPGQGAIWSTSIIRRALLCLVERCLCAAQSFCAARFSTSVLLLRCNSTPIAMWGGLRVVFGARRRDQVTAVIS